MTKDEAERECARLAAEDPGREVAQWLPQEGPERQWSVVRVGLAPQGELTEETRADAKPPTGEDTRSIMDRQVGGPWGT